MTYRIFLLSWLFWLVPLSLAYAEPTPVSVRVGVFDNPPIIAVRPGTPPEGIAIDLLREVANREGWKITYVSDSWDRLLSQLDRGEIDVLTGIAYTPERAEQYRFTQQSLIGNWGMVFRHAGAPIESLPDLKGMRVALMQGSIHSQALVELAKRFDSPFTPVYVDSYADVLKAIVERRADAGAVNRVYAALHAHQADVVVTGIVFNPIFVHYAAPLQASPALIDSLDRHLAALKADPNSVYYKSLRHWLEAAPEGRVPDWLPWVAAIVFSLRALALSIVAFLRYQVQRQTGELSRRADLLQTEVEQRVRAEGHLNKLAYFDGLTQLSNREGFSIALNQALLALDEHDRLAMLFIDVDRLKNVNDGLGHGAGDLLLQQVAQRFQSVLREQDHLSRFGGDEFVVIVPRVDTPSDAERVANRLLQSLALPISIGPTQIYTSASIGIALAPDDAATMETLIKHADTAMYQAKEQGGNRCRFYHTQQTARVVERLTLDTRLRQALEWGELLLHFQPIVDLNSQRMVGVEALLRWEDPTRGLIMPGAFIAAAEDTGLIVPLGEWVLEAGCAQLRAWQKQGRAGHMTLAINVSTRQFEGRRLVSSVEQALARTGLAAECLELEITENVMLIMNDDVRGSLDSLRQMGVKLALDDFGTGYSSLNYLKQLPFHSLKIDQSFVAKIPGEAGDIQLVTTILALAKGLGLQVIAEGIETQEQYDFLRANGCEFGQGYLMSRPLPADQLLELLDRDASGIGIIPVSQGPHTAT